MKDTNEDLVPPDPAGDYLDSAALVASVILILGV
jgi:hypothetical protein